MQAASIPNNKIWGFYLWSFFSVCCFLAAFYFEQKLLFVIPAVVVFTLIAIQNYRFIYFFLLALIPLSIEFDVTSSLATDLPTEPLMVSLLGIVCLLVAKNIKNIRLDYLKNSIGLFLLLHLVWIGISAIFSTVPIFSLKFILAKGWYIAAFFIMTLIIVRSEADVKKIFWTIYISLTFTIVVALVRHALTGFAFDAINPVLRPFYRNHVNYAAIVSVFFPFVLMARKWYPKYSVQYNLLVLSALIYIVAVYFSYTRACYIALAVMLPAYFIFRFNWTKIAVIASLIALVFVGRYIVHENHYLFYTPTTNTVSQHEFGDLVDATFKAEDVSSMERIYRWVAAVHMINERPMVGFGPNSFVENYKNYTVFVFETWISENEERSGVHNYFLMTAVEQGLIGLIVFVALLIAFFVKGSTWYQRVNQEQRTILMAVLLSMLALTVNLLFSDMIEVDKTGSFFFINLALLLIIANRFKGFIVLDKK